MAEENSDDVLFSDKSEGKSDRYSMLESIAGFFKVLAFFIALGVGVYAFTVGYNTFISAVIILFVGMLYGLGLFVVAELIKVFIDIEHNTRKAAEKK